MTFHTLPDNPVYAFCPAYDIENMPQQIRIVFDNMPGYVPTALFALTLDCQSASKIDPLSACNIDPPEWHGGGCPGSQ